MKMKKVLKIIICLIIITIIFLMIHTIKNFIIVSKLQNKIAEYIGSTNYHIETSESRENGIIIKTDYYRNENKQVLFTNTNVNGETTKLSVYDNGQHINMFTERENLKEVRLNIKSNTMKIDIVDYLQNDNKFQTILSCMISQITSVKLNEKDCYKINNFASSQLWLGTEKNEIYIEKDTGLCIKTNEDNLNIDIKYEFNNVEDSIFIEPDISQYTLKEN